jgi:hypothetical protein
MARENVYVCEKCGGFTVTIDVDEGVTPFMIRCRAKDVVGNDAILPGCKGNAVSSFYPEGPRPSHIQEPAWEWYAPSSTEFESLDSATKDHVYSGGLILRAKGEGR